ncbi:hypothetical protein HCH_03027 [Hahella chejuensis KCTC 2396]|uniref:Uncharacterized protein n=1 Tax=Hahella chejuensis (strain KCTC 2396) TaxID=349521 RepID=Q2SHT0_HAHCH|nr:hypothetical protein HCH_03027 [Hahella chejuensis KCTC 2396]
MNFGCRQALNKALGSVTHNFPFLFKALDSQITTDDRHQPFHPEWGVFIEEAPAFSIRLGLIQHPPEKLRQLDGLFNRLDCGGAFRQPDEQQVTVSLCEMRHDLTRLAVSTAEVQHCFMDFLQLKPSTPWAPLSQSGLSQ